MSGGTEENYYLTLGLGREASFEEIKKAFHKLALKHHPDKNPGDVMAADRFRKVHKAYQVLSDPERRKNYDNQNSGFFVREEIFVEPYLDAEASHKYVKVNEEVEVTYAFCGEGRFFRTPPMPGFLISSGPLVDHREVYKKERYLRETLLTYTICPLQPGRYIMPPASISFAHRKVESNSWFLMVSPNDCYFKKGESAGMKPFKIILYKEQATSNSVYRKIKLQQHLILIPRCDLAAWYHKVGSIMKIGISFCGMAWALVNDQNILYGALAGSVIAGVNCQLMYRLMGIKSKFYYALKFPLVNQYLDKGFSFSTTMNQEFFNSKSWQLIKSLFV
jgi:curved DNA-binding protein CbpA